MAQKHNQAKVSLVRNFTFGVEDSLVSTVGLVSGVAVGGMSESGIILTGAVLIFVEALSMGVGSYLSNQTSEEYEHKRAVSMWVSIPGALVMFVSYFGAGLIPLLPYVMLAEKQAFTISIGASLVALFILGFWAGLSSRLSPILQGLRMAVFGGLAIGGGVLVGSLFGI